MITTYPAHATMTSPFGEDTPVLYCPICGKQVITQDKKGMQDIEACPHLAFAMVDGIPDEWYTCEDYAKRKEQHPDLDYLDAENIVDFLSGLGYDESMLVIELVGNGMACGPVSMSVILGFDLGAESRKSSESSANIL